MISRRTTVLRAGATVVVAAFLATGCSSSKSSPTPPAASTSSASSASSSTSSAAPAGDQPSDTAAAESAVKDAYNKFFDNSIDQATKATLVQNAAKLQGLLTALAAGANGQKSTIQVNTVTFTSATHAKVDFAILLNGQPALPHADGDAIYDTASSKWQVAASTLCKLGAITPTVTPDILKAAGCS